MKKKVLCLEHVWVEEAIRDKNFGVSFGAIRTCSVCGKKQIVSYCEGRIGGWWRDVVEKEKP